MEEQKQTSSSRAAIQSLGGVNIQDVLIITLHHWYIVLLSILFCVGAAYLWLARIPDMTTRSMEIMLKGENKEGISAEDLAVLGIKPKGNSNLNNEIYTLTSRDVMQEVVRRLKLDVSYYEKGMLYRKLLYGPGLPVKVDCQNLPEDAQVTFDFDLSKNGNAHIFNVIYKGKETGIDVKNYKLGTPVKLPVGQMSITKGTGFIPGEAHTMQVERLPVIDAANFFSSRFNAGNVNTESSVVLMLFTDESIERADNILNTLVEVYNDEWIKDSNRSTVSTNKFINERIASIEQELGSVESSLGAYKAQNRIVNSEELSSMYIEKGREAEGSIEQLKAENHMINFVRSYIQDESRRFKLLPTNAGIENGSVNGMITQYNELIMKRKSLIAQASEKSPAIIAIDESLDDLKQLMFKTMDNAITINNKKIQLLQDAANSSLSNVAGANASAQHVMSIERQQKVKESLYLMLLQRREENELSQAFAANNTRIVNKPGPSKMPTTPNRQKTLLIAFAIGLLAPFGVVYILEMLDATVRGRKDLEHLTLPFLGEIPLFSLSKGRVRSSRRRKKLFGKKDSVIEDKDRYQYVVKEGKRDIINEAFRVLRTNVEFMNVNEEGVGTVYAITSFNPGSGKSFIAVNLAKTLSLKKKRVIVIDGDMRHASASRYVNSPEPGLSNYLSGKETDYHACIVPADESGFMDVLPVGKMPPNPAELLASPTFDKLIADLRKEYDVILIDCPPIEVVADAQIIDHLVDRTIFIVRTGLLERRMLPELEKLYSSKKYKNMAIILNATESSGRYGYYKGYSYSYGYGYGYSYGKAYESAIDSDNK